MVVDINERGKRREELEKKLKEDMIKAKLEQRKRLEEKMKVIKARERSFDEKQKQAEQSIKQKLALKYVSI